MHDESIPYGFCQCGCGRKTELAKWDDARYGAVRGKPRRFVLHHHRRQALSWREEDRGYRTPCWIWQGTQAGGYGWIRRDGHRYGAHRYVYEQRVGPIPEGLHIDHLCRQPICVNPDHLDPCTMAENTRRGDATKLTWEDVHGIRSLSAQGWGQRDIGRAYDISCGRVSDIVLRKAWVAP